MPYVYLHIQSTAYYQTAYAASSNSYLSYELILNINGLHLHSWGKYENLIVTFEIALLLKLLKYLIRPLKLVKIIIISG